MLHVLAVLSQAFLFNLALAAGLLIVAGIVLAVLTWGLRANVGHAWKAYCGWLFMTPLLILCFFLGREAAIVFLTVVAILGFREFARATELGNDWIITATVYLGIIATGIVCWMSNPADGNPGWYGL